MLRSSRREEMGPVRQWLDSHPHSARHETAAHDQGGTRTPRADIVTQVLVCRQCNSLRTGRRVPNAAIATSGAPTENLAKT